MIDAKVISCAPVSKGLQILWHDYRRRVQRHALVRVVYEIGAGRMKYAHEVCEVDEVKMPKTISVLEDDIATIDVSIGPGIPCHSNQDAAVGSVWVPILTVVGSGVTGLIQLVADRVGHSPIATGDLDHARIIGVIVFDVSDHRCVSIE